LFGTAVGKKGKVKAISYLAIETRSGEAVAIGAFYLLAGPEDCLNWFFMLTISFVKMLAAPRANIAKTISIGPKKKTMAAPITQPANGHSTVSRSLLFLVPGSSSNIAIPEAKPAAVTTGPTANRGLLQTRGLT
jgi:hypothetical protein